MQPTFDLSTARELDARATDGVDVRLLWNPASAQVAVEVIDRRTGTQFAIAIDGADAQNAFYHPFAYAARDELLHATAARKTPKQPALASDPMTGKEVAP